MCMLFYYCICIYLISFIYSDSILYLVPDRIKQYAFINLQGSTYIIIVIVLI